MDKYPVFKTKKRNYECARRAPRAGSTEAKVAEWYKTLDLQPGADMAQIKSSYRQLMRKYHPDHHTQSAEKQRAANEVAQRLTEAYKLLEKTLRK